MTVHDEACRLLLRLLTPASDIDVHDVDAHDDDDDNYGNHDRDRDQYQDRNECYVYGILRASKRIILAMSVIVLVMNTLARAATMLISM